MINFRTEPPGTQDRGNPDAGPGKAQPPTGRPDKLTQK